MTVGLATIASILIAISDFTKPVLRAKSDTDMIGLLAAKCS
jgi:hypothetical protein